MVFRYYVVFCVLISLSQFVKGQNLIPNPSFETRRNIFYSKRLFLLSNWNSPNKGIPWLIRRGKSHFGEQRSVSGKNYLLIAYSHTKFGSVDYELFGCIQAKLKTKLDSGQMYCIELQSSLADIYNYAVPNLQVGFSSKKINQKESGLAIKTDRLLQLQHQNLLLDDRLNWTRNCANFISNGKEKFIQIGFLNEKTTMVKSPVNNDHKIQVGYFIDEVSLKKISDSSSCSCGKIKPNISQNDSLKQLTITPNSITQKLGSIYYDIDSFNITETATAELDAHIEFLKRYETTIIQITGHTDSTGSETHNTQLAEKRANQVANYLIKNGVDEKRLVIQVMASKSPKGDNTTKEGRRLNRRVSFDVIMKD